MTSDYGEQLLQRIDAKLGALLAIVIDHTLRASGQKRTRERSLDALLADSGLASGEIASLLGKTDRAVRLALQKEREKGEKRHGTRSEPDAQATS